MLALACDVRVMAEGDDELLEVTPDALRLRKRLLKENDRKHAKRKEQVSG